MIMTRFNDSSLTSVRHRRILIGMSDVDVASKHVDYINRRPSLAITGPALALACADTFNGVGV